MLHFAYVCCQLILLRSEMCLLKSDWISLFGTF